VAASGIVAIGASAGGVESLRRLVHELPTELPAAVAVVLHLAPTSRSLLAQILSRSGALPAHQATDKCALEDGHIYVAAPDHHLLVEDHQLRVSRGATENGVRPAVDPLFRTAAATFGTRAIGVVLSGSLDDGTAGLFEIKRRGGWTMVQDPTEALYPAMPSSAIEHVTVDVVADSRTLATHIVAALSGGSRSGPVPKTPLPDASDVRPSGMSCPDCNGQLWEMHAGDQVRYRCRVGHEWTGMALIDGQERALENTLWAADRIVSERIQLTRRMLERASARRHPHVQHLLERRLAELEAQDERLREALAQPVTTDTESDPSLHDWVP
jgi:two-component system, chemotaxis family, protein-glutamate methylesterase/glutaminase